MLPYQIQPTFPLDNLHYQQEAIQFEHRYHMYEKHTNFNL